MGQRISMSWQSDKSWSDRFIPEFRAVVGPNLLVPSTLEQDRLEAADLVVLRGRDLTIACRVRRPGYLAYKHQFTIRCHRDSGAKTELEKIVEGWGDWMLYGHADEDEKRLAFWMLLDLDAWRAHLIRDKGKIVRGVKSNGDGTAFAWFDTNSFPSNPPLIIDQKI